MIRIDSFAQASATFCALVAEAERSGGGDLATTSTGSGDPGSGPGSPPGPVEQHEEATAAA